MYKVVTVEDRIRVPPIKFGLSSEQAIKSSLEDLWEGIIDKRLGVILSVVSIEQVGEGKIFPGDGGIHYPVTFKVLTFAPEVHELITGNVIDVTEFGVFVRIGPLDGMVHVSQIMNDFVTYDQKNSLFAGRDSKRVLKEGDVVKARVISVSMGREYKIGLTMRQSGLGALEWIEKDRERREKGKVEEKPVKKEKKKK